MNLNILCLFPGMSATVNDNAHMLIRLREKGAKLVIITGKSMALKGKGNFLSQEDMSGIPIYRLYKNAQEMLLFPGRNIKKILEIANDLKPDLIFCEQELNIRLALLIQKTLRKPLVLMVEDAGRIFSGELYNSMKARIVMRLFGIPTKSKFWSWLCEKSDVLITCNPKDQKNLAKLSIFDKPVFYLPWPSYVPDDFEKDSEREKDTGIYIGSLYPFKNTQEFERTLPLILKKTKTKRFIVVGPGPQASIVRKLQAQYGEAINYFSHLPRTEALKWISKSYFAYSPVKTGGWGFIGDCWSMKTPLVLTHDDNYGVDKVNVMVANNEEELILTINKLYDDSKLYQSLQDNGYSEYEIRKASVVGDKLFEILKDALMLASHAV